VAPTAAFTATTSGLTASVDGAGSSDPDGTVVSHAWEFGDGASATGATASHAYTTPGTYTVVLTVTDDDGAVDTESTSVTVTAPGPVAPALAADAFSRTVASGFGSSDTGGAWSTFVGNATMSVSGGAGHMEVAGPGGSAAGYLGSISVSDVAMQVNVSLDHAPTGGGTWVYLTSRWTGSNYYRAVVRFVPDGSVALGLSRVVNGAETSIQSVNLPGLTYTPGTVLRVRFDTSGTDVTTLKAKAWVTGSAEPAEWQVVATDTTEVLRAAGRIGLATYVSGAATGIMRVNVDDLWAGAAGSAPPAGP
jgi:PKD repeat protein